MFFFRLQCIFCEKTFKNYHVLREHMRKKKHLKLNPRNSTYDKFFLVNYLEDTIKKSEVEDSDENEHNSEENSEENEGEEEKEYVQNHPFSMKFFRDIFSAKFC